MKKLFSIALVCMASLSVNAQNLTQQMFQLYNGHVKTLTQSIEGTSEKATACFDRNGRVLSVEQSGVKLEYSWNGNNSVEIQGYMNGQYQGNQMIYISELSSSRYRYEMGPVSFAIDFKANGAISKQIISAEGQSQSTYFYYGSSSDTMPYKVVTSMGGQSMSMMVDVHETDGYGNPIRYTQTANDQSVTYIYDIIYY